MNETKGQKTTLEPETKHDGPPPPRPRDSRWTMLAILGLGVLLITYLPPMTLGLLELIGRQ